MSLKFERVLLTMEKEKENERKEKTSGSHVFLLHNLSYVNTNNAIKTLLLIIINFIMT